MKSIKYKTIIFLPVVFFVWGQAFSQSQAGKEEIKVLEIKTFLSKTAVHPGGAFKVALLLKINPGWHINGHELADEFLFPTSLSFEETDSFKVVDYFYSKPTPGKFEYSEVELLVYEGEAVIAALVKSAKDLKLGQYKLKGEYKYQACDSRSCLMPRTVDLEIPFEVVDHSQETKEINPEIFSKIEFEKSEK